MTIVGFMLHRPHLPKVSVLLQHREHLYSFHVSCWCSQKDCSQEDAQIGFRTLWNVERVPRIWVSLFPAALRATCFDLSCRAAVSQLPLSLFLGLQGPSPARPLSHFSLQSESLVIFKLLRILTLGKCLMCTKERKVFFLYTSRFLSRKFKFLSKDQEAPNVK